MRTSDTRNLSELTDPSRVPIETNLYDLLGGTDLFIILAIIFTILFFISLEIAYIEDIKKDTNPDSKFIFILKNLVLITIITIIGPASGLLVQILLNMIYQLGYFIIDKVIYNLFKSIIFIFNEIYILVNQYPLISITGTIILSLVIIIKSYLYDKIMEQHKQKWTRK